jgi:diacylglycerol kinase (ATP)
MWHEVAKSRDAPGRVKQAIREGAGLIFVWGGDGMVQRCVGALAHTDTALAIVPAGTANLLASNLRIPRNIEAAVAIGLRGQRHKIDVGRMNGERFAVMAGAGFDARMVHDADGKLKQRLGRLAYVWTGLRNLRAAPFEARIDVDGAFWYEGKTTCVLFGNVGHLFAGVEVFRGAQTDDGLLEFGIVTAEGLFQWVRTIARTVFGDARKSRFVRATTARSVSIELDRKVLYELDGGDRKKTLSLRVDVEPAAVTVCVPPT